MIDKNKHFSLEDPEVPSSVKEASRNHGGMIIPDDFFTQFERKMNAVIDADVAAHKSAETPKVETTIIDWRHWMTVAAAVVVVVALTLFVRTQTTGETPADTAMSKAVASVEETEIESIEYPEQVADELMASVSDFDVFDLYCDI